MSSHAAVVGLQYGDEGKGKVIDYLMRHFDVGVRWQGGGNAGHTVYRNGKKIVLHHLPVSALYPDKISVLGNGMVIDPIKLKEELAELPSIGNIKISRRAHVTNNDHISKDSSGSSVGSTCRGIGPTYVDKYNRKGQRMFEFACNDILNHNRTYIEIVTETRELLNTFDQEGKSILFEGAQGVMLDIDFGTYPYVTSSHTSFLGLGQGTGFSPRKIDTVLGVTKVYCTRVGNGPFKTEDESLRDILKSKGIEEKGATTGRDRRVGHLNIDELRYAVEVSDVDALILTKTDVLANTGEVKVYVNGKYEMWSGWTDPKDMTVFIAKLGEAVGRPVAYVSYGPGTEEIVQV